MFLTFLPNRVWRAYTGGKHIDALQGKTPQISRFPEEWIASCALAFNPDRVTPGEGAEPNAGRPYSARYY